nr:AC5 [Papaya leaf curl Haveri virus]
MFFTVAVLGSLSNMLNTSPKSCGNLLGRRSRTRKNITLFVCFLVLIFSSIHIFPNTYTDLTQKRLPTLWVNPVPRVTSLIHITFPI